MDTCRGCRVWGDPQHPQPCRSAGSTKPQEQWVSRPWGCHLPPPPPNPGSISGSGRSAQTSASSTRKQPAQGGYQQPLPSWLPQKALQRSRQQHLSWFKPPGFPAVTPAECQTPTAPTPHLMVKHHESPRNCWSPPLALQAEGCF